MQSPPQVRPAQRWSWSLVTLAGVDVRVHVTFLVLLGWIALSHLSRGQGVGAVLEGFAVIGIVFSIVVLHEFGHALVARRFGIRTRDITLLPIGGVARLERMPSVPRQELLVALAGPAVNVVLALLGVGALALLGGPLGPGGLSLTGGPLLSQFVRFNVLLAAFNLLPAFPMDGGRALRALLAMRMDRVRATDVAARVGRWMAIGFGLVGLFGNPMLVFIALFVWIGAGEEATMAHVHASLESMHVRDAMITSFETLPTTATVGEGVDHALHSIHRKFPVLDGDRLVGFVIASELIAAGAGGRTQESIGAITHPVDGVTGPRDSIEGVLERLEASEAHVLPVVESNRVIGLVLPENILALVALRQGGLPTAHA